ncbi:altered inheritance of mitochondria protein 18, mitochondrial [Scheffersomyces coipomensis]|uniref:altered inheritance of mitochondria protein 18, mitochondrial n=1 Tax=Scheffersomyces coipomensis TaxID=1788519 RepID=UPI00315DF9AF
MFRLIRSSIRRYPWGKLSTNSQRALLVRPSPLSTVWVGLSMAGAGVVLSGLTTNNSIKLEKDNQALSIEESVSVDSSIDAFPLEIKQSDKKHLHQNYQMLGFGVRAVTFVGFKVYGAGIYISKDDIKQTKTILKGEDSISEEKLLDVEQSVQIINKLVENQVRFLVRISPVRNTDFNHLKDGITKSILAHPLAKQERERMGEGLEQLKQIFQKNRGSVPKNHLLYLEVLKGGKLSITYEDPIKNRVVEMGIVEEPLVSKALILQYLSGKKPLSDSLRKSSIHGLSELIK